MSEPVDTPSMDEIREEYVAYNCRNHDAYQSGVSTADLSTEYDARFDRALAAHDAEVLAAAALIARSSFGAPEAQALRASVSEEKARSLVAEANSRSEARGQRPEWVERVKASTSDRCFRHCYPGGWYAPCRTPETIEVIGRGTVPLHQPSRTPVTSETGVHTPGPLHELQREQINQDFARVTLSAADLFDRDGLNAWFRHPSRQLSNETPLQAVINGETDRVLALLEGLKDGVVI